MVGRGKWRAEVGILLWLGSGFVFAPACEVASRIPDQPFPASRQGRFYSGDPRSLCFRASGQLSAAGIQAAAVFSARLLFHVLQRGTHFNSLNGPLAWALLSDWVLAF